MKADPLLEGLDEQTLKDVLTKMWIFAHGLAFLVNNNAFSDDENYVLETIKDTGKLLILGKKITSEHKPVLSGIFTDEINQ